MLHLFTVHVCWSSEVLGHLLFISNQFRFEWHQAGLTGIHGQARWNTVAAVRTLPSFRIVSPKYWVGKPGVTFGHRITMQDVVAKKSIVQIRKSLLPVAPITVLEFVVYSYSWKFQRVEEVFSAWNLQNYSRTLLNAGDLLIRTLLWWNMR